MPSPGTSLNFWIKGHPSKSGGETVSVSGFAPASGTSFDFGAEPLFAELGPDDRLIIAPLAGHVKDALASVYADVALDVATSRRLADDGLRGKRDNIVKVVSCSRRPCQRSHDRCTDGSGASHGCRIARQDCQTGKTRRAILTNHSEIRMKDGQR